MTRFHKALKTRLSAVIVTTLTLSVVYAQAPAPAPTSSAPSSTTPSPRDPHRWTVDDFKETVDLSLTAHESKGPMFSEPTIRIHWDRRDEKFRVWLMDYRFNGPPAEEQMQVAWRMRDSQSWSHRLAYYKNWFVIDGQGATCQDEVWTDDFVFRAMRNAEVSISFKRDNDISTAKFDVSGFAEAVEKIPALKEAVAKIKRRR